MAFVLFSYNSVRRSFQIFRMNLVEAVTESGESLSAVRGQKAHTRVTKKIRCLMPNFRMDKPQFLRNLMHPPGCSVQFPWVLSSIPLGAHVNSPADPSGCQDNSEISIPTLQFRLFLTMQLPRNTPLDGKTKNGCSVYLDYRMSRGTATSTVDYSYGAKV
jgi:hypothetical protein